MNNKTEAIILGLILISIPSCVANCHYQQRMTCERLLEANVLDKQLEPALKSSLLKSCYDNDGL